MKEIITILSLMLTTVCFGQKNGHYTHFDSAFANIDSVRSLSITCIDGNRYRITDNCDNLPDSIDKLINLEELYVIESNLTTLPASINNLHRLKIIGLNNLRNLNYEAELHKLIGLDSLEYMGIWKANIKQLPSCIKRFKSLKELNISYNNLLNINHTIKLLEELPNLENINISGIDNYRVIPKDIIRLKKLTSIHLNYLHKEFKFKKSFNRLSALPIKSISIGNNGLRTLPKSITSLDKLTTIDLSDNYFKSLPDEIYSLKELKTIIIERNTLSLEIIEKEILNLKNLERIDLSNNPRLDGVLSIINLSKSPELKDIDLFNCRLDTIPSEIGNFKALEKLNLASNPEIDFSNLLINLSKLKTLKHLNISENELTSIPKEIGLLTSLEHLIVGLNAISSLPEEFFNLKNLKVISVFGNYNCRMSETEIEKIRNRLPNCKIIDEWEIQNY